MSNSASLGAPRLALVMEESIARYFRPALERYADCIVVAELEPEGRVPDAEFAVAVRPPAGHLASMPSLQCVIAPGAGADHILADPYYPHDVPLARLDQPDMLQRMKEYVALHVLNALRTPEIYRDLQTAKKWEPIWPQRSASECTVGFMGLGTLGAPISQLIAELGFRVIGWARSPKKIDNVETYWGNGQFDDFLRKCQILVNILPATAQTRHILNASSLAKLPIGATIINVGRGSTMDEGALLNALDNRTVDRAILDVFEVEPLPVDSPLWKHPKVVITPHCASAVAPEELAAGVCAVVKRVSAGKRPRNLIDVERGY